MLRAIYHYLKHRLGRFLARTSIEICNPESDQEINRNEICVRFLFDAKEFSSGSVRDKAFEPNSKTNNVSVYISSRFKNEEAFNLTRQRVTEMRGRSLKGQANLFAGDVDDVRCEMLESGVSTDLRLFLDERLVRNEDGVDQVYPNGNPHHANIEGWPADKNHRLLIKKALAARCQLVKVNA